MSDYNGISKAQIKMEALFHKYRKTPDDESVRLIVDSVNAKADLYQNPDSYKPIMGLLDLTTLNATDTVSKVRSLCEKVNKLNEFYPAIPNVAAICIHPALVETVRENLKVDSVRIASVAGGFPSSQTFLEIKISECEMALKAGADEIDVVISLGKFLEGKYDVVFEEIKELKKIAGRNNLKIILETGSLPSYSGIHKASILAMEAGADFIKTSTGKLQPAATIEAVCVMCHAIRDFHVSTGKKVGIKPAGGLSVASDTLPYYILVSDLLGEEWLSPSLFRFGASRLANSLITEIESFRTETKNKINYF